ncbi:MULTISPECIES: GNAT family N-acetyltransferase [Anaerolinea]|uniref:GNAT family N-acetyltransferase n=1 Tax=Anaerolinea TaxID=233189 RepID=UPI002618C2BD|nr:GNAT family N-acetyltransferase [Anaerolinea thermophila]
MPQVAIRPAVSSDLPALSQIVPSYYTVKVWQMDRGGEEEQIQVRFREVRLPREVLVEYPRSLEDIFQEGWLDKDIFLTASLSSIPVGFARLALEITSGNLWVKDLIVRHDLRREGIGTALLIAVQDYALERRYRRIMLEMQSKNYPAIQLAKKLGYEFSGFSDAYFANQDIALFFAQSLR